MDMKNKFAEKRTMKFSDFVIKFVEEQGVKHIFAINGGAAAHLLDSIDKNKTVKLICPQHEQAAAMAADAYSRVSENLGVSISTSGPGATNMITGIACAFYDSIPTLFISGQVATFRQSKNLKVRQLGFQETKIVDVIKTLTKYAVCIEDPNDIKYELEKAVYFARKGRPGPVFIDIPDDLQRVELNLDELKSFKENKILKDNNINKKLKEVINLLNSTKRPVIVFGGGINLSKARYEAIKFAEELGIPVLLTWAIMDLLPYNHPLLVGSFGINGLRYGNFTIQNADLIISIGSKLDTHATGSPVTNFGRGAKKIIIDIDQAELDKFHKWNFKVDIPIKSDAKFFLKEILEELKNVKKQDFSEWFEIIKKWKKNYAFCKKEDYEQKEKTNPFVFIEKLSNQLKSKDVIIADTGCSLAQTMTGIKVKSNQRLFSAFNNTPMGYSLPASIGAYYASENKRIISINGDGGFQMNIQELGTISMHKLPVKIFVFNNKGYGMIKETQNQWLDSNYVGSSSNDIATPDFVRIAKAYGIPALRINNNSEIDFKLKTVMNSEGPFLCDVSLLDNDTQFLTTKFGKPIEDISPLLDRGEFLHNMIILPIDEND